MIDRELNYEKNLSNREMQIVRLIAMGMKNKEVAEKLNLSEGTVKVNCVKIFKKLKVKNRTALAMLYLKSFDDSSENN